LKVGAPGPPRADQDIDEIANYLVQVHGLDAGLRFIEAAARTLRMLGDQPHLGWYCRLEHPCLRSARAYPVLEFDKILIFYLADAQRIEVLRILNEAQHFVARLAEFQ
jgi:plasmid stabilization system protein ParE